MVLPLSVVTPSVHPIGSRWSTAGSPPYTKRAVIGRNDVAVVGDGCAVAAERRKAPPADAGDADHAIGLAVAGVASSTRKLPLPSYCRHGKLIPAWLVLPAMVAVAPLPGQTIWPPVVPLTCTASAFAIVGGKAHAPPGRQLCRRRQGDGQPGRGIVTRQHVAVVGEVRRVSRRRRIQPVAWPMRRLEAHVRRVLRVDETTRQLLPSDCSAHIRNCRCRASRPARICRRPRCPVGAVTVMPLPLSVANAIDQPDDAADRGKRDRQRGAGRVIAGDCEPVVDRGRRIGRGRRKNPLRTRTGAVD